MRGIYYKTERRIFYCKSKKFFTHTPFLFFFSTLSLLMGAVRHAGKTGVGNQSGMLRTCYSLVRRSRQRTKHQSLHSSKPNVRRQRGIVPACFVALFTACKRTFWWKTVWKSCILYGVLKNKKQLNLNYRKIQYYSITNLFEDSNCCFGTHFDTAIYVN